jgi:MHS family shikimate/dehydroshikimate transporter-like MFS transporter
MESLDRLGGEDQGQRTSIWKIGVASLIGTTIEWYDFFLYGAAAALVFNVLFFPTGDPVVGTLAAFATFAVGFFARPVGGIVAGHFGDRIGRKIMLVLTLTLMGIATFLIGLLPSYAAVGIWAPILLVTLRFLQGFAVGGEWGGAVLMILEHAPENRRGFYASWPQMGIPAGIVLSLAAFAVVSALVPEQEQFLSWGWRLPFLISIILVAVGLYIRLRILETPAFTRVRESGTISRMPVIDVLRTYPKNVLLATGSYLGFNVSVYILITFLLSYATVQLELPRGAILNSVVIGAALMIFSIPVFGALSDRFGRRPVFMAGTVFMALFSFPFFWLVDTRVPGIITLAVAVAFFGLAVIYGPLAAFFSELFDTRVRYSGASLGYQFGSVFGGGLAPFIATALMSWAGGQSWPVALYMLVMFIISLVSIYFLAETYKSELAD